MPKKGNAEEKNVGGRPQDYKESVHIELMREKSEGAKTTTELFKAMGLPSSTFYLWLNTYPKFMEEYKRSQSTIRRNWMDYLIDPNAKKVDTTLLIFWTKAHYHDTRDHHIYYSDKNRREQEAHEQDMRIKEESHRSSEALKSKQLHEGAPPRDTIQLQEGILEGVNKIADRLIAQEVNKP